MACTTGCRTKDHASYGECLRAKEVRLPAQGFEAQQVQSKADRELEAYRIARRQGIQPKSTKKHHIDHAVRVSNETGEAYKAS